MLDLWVLFFDLCSLFLPESYIEQSSKLNRKTKEQSPKTKSIIPRSRAGPLRMVFHLSPYNEGDMIDRCDRCGCCLWRRSVSQVSLSVWQSGDRSDRIRKRNTARGDPSWQVRRRPGRGCRHRLCRMRLRKA